MSDDAKRPGLDTSPRLARNGDDVYSALMAAHRGLSADESHRLNARLVLMLANHIGDTHVVIEAIRRARDGVTRGASGDDKSE